MSYKALYLLMLFVLCLSASCLWSEVVYATDDFDKGDPALSVSSTHSLPGDVATKGDPALSVSSNPAHTKNKGDPALSVSSAPSIDPAACRALIKHTPDEDIAYQPAVDTNGHSVAPVDVSGGTQIHLPKTFNIPLTLGLANALNLDTTKYPISQLGPTTEVPLGTLTVSGEHVLFNGQPLSDEQQNNLSVLCMKANGK